MSDHNDFRAAVDVQIVRWQFQQIVDAEFARGTSTPGSVPRVSATTPPARTGGVIQNHAL